MSATISPSIKAKDAILFAIRDNKFPEALDNHEIGSDELFAAIKGLSEQGFVAVKKLATTETGKGSDFVLKKENPNVMPQEAELTVAGERFVDQKRGIDSRLVETQGKAALLDSIKTSPKASFDTVEMPEHIGPQRKRFLIKQIIKDGLATKAREQTSQGFITVSRDIIKITPEGSLELTKLALDPDGIEKEFRSVRRQLLINMLEKNQPVGTAHTHIKTNLPGWGPDLFNAAIKPLFDAKLIMTSSEQKGAGFFSVSSPVMELCGDKTSSVTISNPLNTAYSKTVTTSGKDVAAALLANPKTSIEVHLPTNNPNTKEKQSFTL